MFSKYTCGKCVGGYIAILTRLSRIDKNRQEQTGYMQATFEDKLGKTGKQLTWEDVGEEFKQAIYDLLSLVRQAIDKKKDRWSNWNLPDCISNDDPCTKGAGSPESPC